jgi:hypothetical protein
LFIEYFPEDPFTAIEVVRRESGFRMVQSNHVYSATNAPAGYAAGQREESHCWWQIHEPVHREMLERNGLTDFKTNIHSCMKAARIVYDQAGGFYPWTEYHKMLAMR